MARTAAASWSASRTARRRSSASWSAAGPRGRMNVYMVDRFIGSGPEKGDRTGMYHHLLFHGVADDSDGPRIGPCLGEPRRPLRLMRNGRRVPEVFNPALNLVVSAAVK